MGGSPQKQETTIIHSHGPATVGSHGRIWSRIEGIKWSGIDEPGVEPINFYSVPTMLETKRALNLIHAHLSKNIGKEIHIGGTYTTFHTYTTHTDSNIG